MTINYPEHDKKALTLKDLQDGDLFLIGTKDNGLYMKVGKSGSYYVREYEHNTDFSYTVSLSCGVFGTMSNDQPIIKVNGTISLEYD